MESVKIGIIGTGNISDWYLRGAARSNLIKVKAIADIRLDVARAKAETFGTQALSDAALQAIDGRRACLLANHGVLAFGDTLDAAYALAAEVESLARMYLLALGASATLGAPVLLDDAQMDRVIERFRTCGRDE